MYEKLSGGRRVIMKEILTPDISEIFATNDLLTSSVDRMNNEHFCKGMERF